MTTRTHPAYDPRGSQVLSKGECRTLLERAAASGMPGRLALSRAGAPYVIPVNFSLGDGAIMVRLGPGYAAFHINGMPVTFEVDHADPPVRAGWSVLVEGVARLLTYEEEARLGRNLPRPLVTTPGVRAFRIQPTATSGRSLRHDTQETRSASCGIDAQTTTEEQNHGTPTR